MKIKIGDTVVVIAGKDNGKQGEVIATFAKKDLVTVKDLNMITKHVKKTAEQAGERITKESPIHVSNVMILDPDGKASRIRYSKDKKKGKIRQFVSTGKNITENFKKA